MKSSNTASLRRAATAYARKAQVETEKGFVVFHAGKPCGWSRALHRVLDTSGGRPNSGWLAGCTAVELATGNVLKAVGGDYQHGADKWVPA